MTDIWAIHIIMFTFLRWKQVINGQYSWIMRRGSLKVVKTVDVPDILGNTSDQTAMPAGIFEGSKTVYGILPSAVSLSFLSWIVFSA